MTNSNIVYTTQRHELVTAKVVTATARTFKFTPNDNVRGKLIDAITFHPNNYLTRDPEGNTLVASAASTNKAFLTLKTTKGTEVVNKLPLYMLAAGVTPGGTYEKMFPLRQLTIDWENSYVTCSEGGLFAANEVLLFSVFFTDQSLAGTC